MYADLNQVKNKQQIFGFGFHLIVDGYQANREKLGDVSLIYSFLEKLPEKIQMHAISNPYIVRYDGRNIPDDWGISAFILIAESHISIHTFPNKNYFNLDTFSCKKFDSKIVLENIKQTFETPTIETYSFERGGRFPRGQLMREVEYCNNN